MRYHQTHGPNVIVGLKRGNRVTNVHTFKPGQMVYIYRKLDPPVFLGCRTIQRIDHTTKAVLFTDPLPEGVTGGDYILDAPVLGDDDGNKSV